MMFRCDECKNKDSCVCVPYGCECFEFDLEKHDAKVRADVIDEYKHNLKETFNNEFPINHQSTQPYFTLDDVRVLADAVAKEMNEQNSNKLDK